MSHFNVESFAVTPELFLFFIYLSHDFNWHSYSHNTVGHILITFYQTHLSNNCPLSNYTKIAYCGSHANNGIISYLGIMNHGTVSYSYMVSKYSTVIGSCVNYYAFFDGCSLSNLDRAVIGTENCSMTDVGILTYLYITDDQSGLGYKSSL